MMSPADLRVQSEKIAQMVDKYQRPFEERLKQVIAGELPALEFLGLGPKNAPALVSFALQMIEENDLDNAVAAAELATGRDCSGNVKRLRPMPVPRRLIPMMFACGVTWVSSSSFCSTTLGRPKRSSWRSRPIPKLRPQPGAERRLWWREPTPRSKRSRRIASGR